MNSNFFNCKNDDKYKKIIVMNNNYTMTFLNFSTLNYSGRSLYRYLLTKIILGDDYDLYIVSNNYSNYYGFYKDGTLGQEIIYYFLEIYCYDRFNFFYNLANEQYLLINELFENIFWSNEYPSIDGVLYIDKSIDDMKEIYGIETIVFTPEIFLNEINNIYINDGVNFTFDIENVTINNKPININFNILKEWLTHFNSSNQIMVGGKKYNKKYLLLQKKYFFNMDDKI
jgi:hypothetical protein